MNRRKAEKILIPIAAVLIFAAFFGAVIYGLAKAPAKTPDERIEGMSPAYSKVLYTGKGYHTTDIQTTSKGETAKVVAEVLETSEEEKKDKKKKEKTKDEKDKKTGEGETDPDKEDDDGNTNNYDDGEEEGDGNKHPDSEDDDNDQEGADKPEDEPNDPNEGKYPIIATDLEDGETVSQSYRTFFVRATNYKGRYIDASGIKVTVVPAGGDSKKLYSTSDDGYKVGYKLNMDAERYTVTIKATDKKGLSSIATYTVNKGEAGEPEPDGEIKFSLEASTVGLGKLIGPTKVEFYQGEQLPYVVDRALKAHGYTYRYQGDYDRGFYLKHVVKGGIADGAKIPDDLLEKLEDAGYTPNDYHQDSLGQYDFSGQSGWIYSVNGANMSTGMSSYYPADGDVVRIRFSLYNGADVGGGVGTSSFGKEW